MPSHNRAVLADIHEFKLDPATAHSKIKASGHLAPPKQISSTIVESVTTDNGVVTEVVSTNEIVVPVVTEVVTVVEKPVLATILPKVKKPVLKKKEKKESN